MAIRIITKLGAERAIQAVIPPGNLDVTGTSFGRFQNVTGSTTSGEASADFVAGIGAPTGTATITARVPDTNLSATIKTTIQEGLPPVAIEP